MSDLSVAPGSAGLDDPAVRAVLNRLYAQAERGDKGAMRRAYDSAAKLAAPPTPAEASSLCADALLPVDPHTGRLLYTLVRMLRPGLVVEFGTSFGTSTVQIAAGLRENGRGRLVTTELDASKVRKARENLAESGLDDLVDVREGDALELLRGFGEPVDLVLLDGWKELYLPVLDVLEPALAPGAVIVSDNLSMLPPEYLERIRDRARGYVSLDLPLGDGIELTTWTGAS
ncbi:class I SAM-dependent methyltransferase [Streptomyces sp. NPDC048717]|uniref:O-methyltransferase n=1 Tax=Streptomyces sp. NPDC048717 TaxID=3154928 RepID=UPI003441F578